MVQHFRWPCVIHPDRSILTRLPTSLYSLHRIYSEVRQRVTEALPSPSSSVALSTLYIVQILRYFPPPPETSLAAHPVLDL